MRNIWFDFCLEIRVDLPSLTDLHFSETATKSFNFTYCPELSLVNLESLRVLEFGGSAFCYVQRVVLDSRTVLSKLSEIYLVYTISSYILLHCMEIGEIVVSLYQKGVCIIQIPLFSEVWIKDQTFCRPSPANLNLFDRK